MKLSTKCTISALVFSSLACDGDFFNRQQKADASNASARFTYAVLVEEASGLAFYDESALLGGGLTIKLLVGNDLNRDHILGDDEVLVSITDSDREDDHQELRSNQQTDLNGDGSFNPTIDNDVEEYGIFTDGAELDGFQLTGGKLPTGEYDLFALEVLDGNGAPVVWKEPITGGSSTRIAYDVCQAVSGPASPCTPEEAEFQKFVVGSDNAGLFYHFGVNTVVPGTEQQIPTLLLSLPASALE